WFRAAPAPGRTAPRLPSAPLQVLSHSWPLSSSRRIDSSCDSLPQPAIHCNSITRQTPGNPAATERETGLATLTGKPNLLCLEPPLGGGRHALLPRHFSLSESALQS